MQFKFNSITENFKIMMVTEKFQKVTKLKKMLLYSNM